MEASDGTDWVGTTWGLIKEAFAPSPALCRVLSREGLEKAPTVVSAFESEDSWGQDSGPGVPLMLPGRDPSEQRGDCGPLSWLVGGH